MSLQSLPHSYRALMKLKSVGLCNTKIATMPGPCEFWMNMTELRLSDNAQIEALPGKFLKKGLLRLSSSGRWDSNKKNWKSRKILA